MPVLVVGTVGIDDVETPRQKRRGLLGGSAAYFSVAASFYTRVLLVSNVGEDFPKDYRDALAARDIDLKGLKVEPGETFYWSGRYRENMIDRDTIETRLNVFGRFDPHLPEEYRACPYVFLANGLPTVQMKVLDQMRSLPRLVAADTMDLWIRTTPGDLEKLLTRIDVLTVNDSEARLMTRRASLAEAGTDILARGPHTVIIKKGEHGATVVGRNEVFLVPAYPVPEVVDPTGAGDSFAGAMMGYLAKSNDLSPENVRRAVVHGAVVASYAVEGFSIEKLASLTRRDIEDRYRALAKMARIPESV